MTQYTSKTEFEEAYSTLFQTFDTGITKSIRWRKWQLKQCWWMVHDNEAQLIEALKEDLGRHDYEAYFGDILSTKSDILDHIKNVEKWAADEIPDAGFIMGTIGKARVRREPLGVVLVIGPWNFPISLILLPIIAAIAAGNCVLMKASEMAKASQAILSDLIPKYLDQRAIRIISGGPQETGYILDHKFNHIFFTGSSKVARFVTAAAAKHLTPVVLELGGQGPAIVTKNANIDLAAKRIAYSKFLNCGQICLSVNHVYADPAIYDKFTERLAHWAEQFMAKGDSHFSRIINSRNFDRLVGLLKGTQGVVSYGGGSNRATNFLALTVVKDIKQDDPLMSEELFGPICPVIKSDYKTAYKNINHMPNPLALYIFSDSQPEIDEIIANTLSGGVTINDVLMHAGVPNAPFGGVGESGYGYYHGIHGFLEFTHRRTVVSIPMWLDRLIAFRYPPYDVSNRAKIEVKNSLGFKRGEKMADQRLHADHISWTKKALMVGTIALGLSIVGRYYNVGIDWRSSLGRLFPVDKTV